MGRRRRKILPGLGRQVVGGFEGGGDGAGDCGSGRWLARLMMEMLVGEQELLVEMQKRQQQRAVARYWKRRRKGCQGQLQK